MTLYECLAHYREECSNLQRYGEDFRQLVNDWASIIWRKHGIWVVIP